MTSLKANYLIDYDSIPIDPYWNMCTDKELKIHRIHAYPAKFPAFITTKALYHAKQNGYNISSVADIFCGCGTTAFETKRNNINFCGCDINPIATLIAKVKSRKYQSKRLNKYFIEIIKYFKSNQTKNDYSQAKKNAFNIGINSNIITNLKS